MQNLRTKYKVVLELAKTKAIRCVQT